MEERLPRKLAAILYADVVGYSRMASEDEDATHRRLKKSLDLIATTVKSYHGRVINYSGDAALAMFDAVVDAVSCAAAIQSDIVSLNRDVPGAGPSFRAQISDVSLDDASWSFSFRVGVGGGGGNGAPDVEFIASGVFYF